MSLIINNDLIWISVPKCASLSIEKALIDSELDIKLHPEYRYIYEKMKRHGALRKDVMFTEFGIHPTVCITRNWVDKWMSGLEFIWISILSSNLTPIINWNEIDNKFIYKTFDIHFSKHLHQSEFKAPIEIFKRLITNPIVEIEPVASNVLVTLLSQNYWKDNNIPHLNTTPKIKNKIEINDELKNYLWNVFEKPFQKRNSLI